MFNNNFFYRYYSNKEIKIEILLKGRTQYTEHFIYIEIYI